tara:strand:- start:68 stop:880 length:813 start_codon:yes stop_codon:yes gene_type:complete
VKKTVLKLFNFYIKSSIHVALSVVSLAFISVKLSQNDILISMLIFIFCSALFAYNFIKFFSIIWEIKKHNFPYLIFCLSLICLIVSIHFFFYLTLSSKIIAVIGGILVVLYTLPLNNEMSNLRNVKGWKVYLVTLNWILLTIVIPFASTLIFEIKLFVQLLLIQSIYIFVAILPFDIHDLNYDSRNLNTLPQQLGVSRVKVLGYVLLIINCIITILCFGFLSPMTLSASLSFIFLAFLLKRSYPTKSKYLSTFWVEAIPIFWAGGFYLFA